MAHALTSLAAFAVSLATVATGADPVIIRVDDDAAPGGDGTAWTAAYRDLQDALDAVDRLGGAPAEVRVAQGTYRPDRGTGDRTAHFALRAGAAIRGGYAGVGAEDPGARDPELFVTVLSGDLAGDDGGGATEENSYRIVDASDVDDSAVLDGVVLTAANGNGPLPWHLGGGMHASAGTPVILECTFADNVAGRGAGAYCEAASPTFLSCRFVGNAATEEFAIGGAVYAKNDANPVFESCVFEDNVAGDDGGALLCTNFSDARCVDCVFVGNVAGTSGGAVHAIISEPELVRCRFAANTAAFGAAVASTLLSQVTVCSSRLVGNVAEEEGGAVHVIGAEVTVIGSFLSGNTADRGGGVRCAGVATVHVSTIAGNHASSGAGGIDVAAGATASIGGAVLWANTSGVAEGEAAQVAFAGAGAVDESCVEGWTGLLGGEGNIGTDPRLWDLAGPDGALGTLDDDPRLLGATPCLDAVSAGSLPADACDLDGDGNLDEPVPLDLLGAARVIGAAPDMGAVEIRRGDLDGDDDVDGADLGRLLGVWGTADPVADLDGNGAVDGADLGLLLAGWT